MFGRWRISICSTPEDRPLANLRAKLRAIGWTAVQDTIRRKVTYLVAFLALLILVIITSQMATVTMATDAGETKVVE